MNLQETIKRVLREDLKKRRKIFYGFSGLPNMWTDDYDNSKTDKYFEDKEYTIFGSAMEGVVYWATITKTGRFPDNLTERIDFVATPFWDGMDYTPIELDYYRLTDKDGYGVFDTHSEGSMYYRTLRGQSEFDNVDELFNWYNEFYLPEVYQYADWELSNKR